VTVLLVGMGVLAVAAAVQGVRLALTRGDWRPVGFIVGIPLLILLLWLLGQLQPVGN